MRIAEVVNQVRLVLPKYTDVLSTLVEVVSVQVVGEVPQNRCIITTTASHNFLVLDPVVLQNFGRKNKLISVEEIPEEEGGGYEFKVSRAHDISYTPNQTITFYGFTDSTWNTAVKLLRVPRRDKLVVEAPEGATLPVLTSSEYIREDIMYGINGYYAVDALDSSTIFSIVGNFSIGDYEGGTLSSNARVAGAVSPDRAIKQYTRQGLTDVWAFVTPEDAIVSKDLHAESDAIATNTASDDYWLRMLDGFTLYLIANTTQDIAGVNAIDLFRHDLLYPVLKTLCGVRFNEGLTTGGDFKTVLSRHGIYRYTKPYLVYFFTFEIPTDIVNEDTAISGTRAFRDVFYTHTIGGTNTVDSTAYMNLDDVEWIP